MVSPTSRSSVRRGGNARAGWAIVVALASLATMPIAIEGTRYSAAYRLLDAGYAIPLGLLLGVGGLLLARSARQRNERALGRLGGEKAIRWARIVATTGICFAVTCLISVGVYAFLQHVGNSK